MFKYLKNIFFSSKEKNIDLIFETQGGKPCNLKQEKVGDFYGKKGTEGICTFEGTNFQQKTFVIPHFSIDEKFRGTGYAEIVLRKFAALMSEQRDDIDQIKFQLYSTNSKAKSNPLLLKKIADARENLMHKLGAKNITKKKISDQCWEVTGYWLKSDW